MFEDLMRTVSSVKSRIEKHRSSLSQNEFRTRIVLIDPILNALGWNVTNPDQVTIEYIMSVGGGTSDYALLQDGKPIAIVEAKKLGADLKNHYAQMLNYANAQGIPYALITDGNTWEMFEVFRPANLEERRMLKLVLTTQPVHSSALNLLMVWNTNLQFGGPTSPKQSVFSPEPTKKPPPPWVPLSDYDPPSGSKPPSRIRFWNKSEGELHSWANLVFLTVQSAFADGRLTEEMLPIGSKNRNHIHNEPRNPDGSDMRNPRKLDGASVFVSIHFSAQEARKRVNKLLVTCGVDPSSVFLLP